MSNCPENNLCLSCAMQSGSCLIGHKIKSAKSLEEADVGLLNFIADIRAAAGDPNGQMGWVEFVNHIKSKMDRVEELECGVSDFIKTDKQIQADCFVDCAYEMLPSYWSDSKDKLYSVMGIEK